MRYVLGFDGGGTKTDCVLMDETGAILSRARSGPSNPSRVPLDSAYAALVESMDKALESVGKSAADIAGVCGAIAGAGLARAIPEFFRRLQLKFPNAATIFPSTDLSMALSATGESPSVLVIAGTGSVAIGRDISGTLEREGGLGPILGDPGSAYDIGRKAVVMEWRRFLKGEESYLRNEILALFNCNWVELQDQIRANPDDALPRIFPLVAKAANEGDESARELLRSAAEDLAEMVEHVVERLHLGKDSFFLAKTGGAFNRSAHLDDHFDELVRKIAPNARIGALPRPVAEFAAQCAVNCLDSPVRKVGS